jgi:molecular chaperone DnaK
MSSTAWSSRPGEQPPVGIDLGTTYSLIAYLDATGRPVTIPNSTGDLLTPSAVFVDEDDVIVGKEAVKSAALSPESYAECFKRDVGSLHFHRKVHRFDVPPEVLSAFVLDRGGSGRFARS